MTDDDLLDEFDTRLADEIHNFCDPSDGLETMLGEGPKDSCVSIDVCLGGEV